jgi:hypothetical protein
MTAARRLHPTLLLWAPAKTGGAATRHATQLVTSRKPGVGRL